MARDWLALCASGHLPTPHQLTAAALAAQVIPSEGASRKLLDGSYGALPTGGIFGRADLEEGERILLAAGLVGDEGSVITPLSQLLGLRALPPDELGAAILMSLLEAARPLWIVSATSQGSLEPELVPDASWRTVAAMLDMDERERRLCELGRRFSDEERRRTGELAEEYLVEALQAQLHAAGRPDLAKQVRRVSLESDELGYDITAPSLGGGVRRIEAKGTRASGPAYPLYLTRNEAEVGLHDEAWSLVVCVVDADDDTQVIGWATGERLQPLLPRDTDPAGYWTTTHLTVTDTVLDEGLPDA